MECAGDLHTTWPARPVATAPPRADSDYQDDGSSLSVPGGQAGAGTEAARLAAPTRALAAGRPPLYAAVLVAVLALAASVAFGASARGPQIGGCPAFPSSNAWNRDVSRSPVDPRSARYIAAISAQGARFLHADFGGNGAYGIPFVVVARSQPAVPVRFDDYPNESDSGPYPIPSTAPVEKGGDRHVLVVRRGECRLYELYNARRSDDRWIASSGAIFNLRSNRLRPAGWTSADAAGLPVLPGLARYAEVRAGAIRHALRFTVQRSQRGYVHPARHYASNSTDRDLPPMGLRLRLRRGYSLSRFRGQSLVILRALKRYGMIVADNGTSWYVTGAADRRWNDSDLDQLKSVPGSAFEVVRSGPIRRG